MNIYDYSHALCLLCQHTVVCICADNKNSIYNKNKHFVVELGSKEPIKALQIYFSLVNILPLGETLEPSNSSF